MAATARVRIAGRGKRVPWRRRGSGTRAKAAGICGTGTVKWTWGVAGRVGAGVDSMERSFVVRVGSAALILAKERRGGRTLPRVERKSPSACQIQVAKSRTAWY